LGSAVACNYLQKLAAAAAKVNRKQVFVQKMRKTTKKIQTENIETSFVELYH